MSIEKQQNKVKYLLTLIEQYPDLRIVPMVETDVVASDDFAWWTASWGSASVEELYISDTEERVYIRSKDEDTLIEQLYDSLTFVGNLSEDEAESQAIEEVNRYKWEKVIAVKITI